jgi:FkbM family methyltransferase
MLAIYARLWLAAVRDRSRVEKMSAIRSFVKSCLIVLWGSEYRHRRILRGLPSGYRIFLSPAENLAYLVGTAEPHLQKAIKDYVAIGDTVYDIGANIGYVSLALAKRVGLTGSVIAFEPVPRNIDMFRKSIEVNRLKNICLLDVAASTRSGEAVIRIAENFATASLVWHRNVRSAQEFVIRTVVVDELVETGKIGKPRFVKIDVEGAEAEVLEGMRRTIAAARPVLFVECSDLGRDKTWNLLRGLGYRCQSATDRKWVDDFEKYRHSDFLWLPLELCASRLHN